MFVRVDRPVSARTASVSTLDATRLNRPFRPPSDDQAGAAVRATSPA